MQYLIRVGLIALGVWAFVSTPNAYALGTDAAVDVTNSVTMSYEVNSISQSTTTSVTFAVDRKYVVSVTTSDTDWVTAIPGQTFASGNYSSLRFTVTNNSNSEVGMRLALIDQGDTDVTGFGDAPTAELIADLVTIWEDTNGNGTFDGGESLGNALGVLPVLTDFTYDEDESRDYYVTIDVDGADAAGLFETYTLVAAVADVATGTTVIATDDSGNSTPGTADPAINPNTLAGVEEVFAEFASGNPEDLGFVFSPAAPSSADEDFDGQASNSSGFRTRVALGIAKYVEVLWDPVTGNKYDALGALTGNDPKAIPGAVMMYVIGVSADSGVDATLVTLDDDIPETLILPGDTNDVPGVELPLSVDITINGPPATTFTLDPAIVLDDQQHVVDCATSTLVSAAFDAGPEIDDASLGDCDSGETGYVLYFVTVNDS